MEKLARSLGASSAMAIAVLTALVSYRLPFRGEEWWLRLVDYASSQRPPQSLDDAVSLVKSYIEHVGRVPLRNQKLKRLQKVRKGPARRLLEALMRDPSSLPSLTGNLVGALASSLSQRPDAKTIVFSIKMAYYVYKASLGRPLEEPLKSVDIPMPVDARVACLTISSHLCDAGRVSDVVSRPQEAQRAWHIVAAVSGIPEIHLDALAWRVGWIPRDYPTIHEARAAMLRTLAKYATEPLVLRLSRELVARLCKLPKTQ